MYILLCRAAPSRMAGVKVNYAKFQGVEVAQEGKKALKIDLLARI